MSLPSVYNALKKWEQDLILIKTEQVETSLGIYETISHKMPFTGVVQPLKASIINTKPVEQRCFEWIQIHAREDMPVILQNGDRVLWQNKNYKVSGVLNYSNASMQVNQNAYLSGKGYGYMEYHACEINIDNDASINNAL